MKFGPVLLELSPIKAERNIILPDRADGTLDNFHIRLPNSTYLESFSVCFFVLCCLPTY